MKRNGDREVNRRDFVLGSSIILGLTGATANGSRILAGPETNATPRLLTSLVVKNTGTERKIGFVTGMFGHAFKKGDMPVGQYPIFRLGTDSAGLCPYSCGAVRTWSDGSMKFASFMLLIPHEVPAGDEVKVDVFNGGSKPAPSLRTPRDFSAGGHNYRVEVEGLYNLNGSWTSDLNAGFSTGEALVWMDGEAGKVWRVRQPFVQNGKPHGQLECYFYCSALQDHNQKLYGLRLLPRLIQKNFDADAPAKAMRVFSRCALTDTGAVVNNSWAASGKNVGVSFDWLNNSGPNNSAKFSVPASSKPGEGLFHGARNSGFCAYLASSGTLPVNLLERTPYFILYSGTPGNIFLGTDAFATVRGNPGAPSFVKSSAAGSGTHTLTLFPFITHFGSFYLAASDGRWQYFRASGTSSTDDDNRVIQDNIYLRSTGMIPPFDFSNGAESTPAQPYIINGSTTLVDQSMSSTGERDELGPLPNWVARFIINRNERDEQTVRVTGLCDAHFSTCFRDSRLGTIPNCANAASYKGIANPTGGGHNLRWRLETARGFLAPTSHQQGTFGLLSFDHMPNYSYGPYLLFGEPQFLDTLLEKANSAVYERNTVLSVAQPNYLQHPDGGERNFVINGKLYQGCLFGTGDNTRRDAWAIRDVAWAAAIVPDTSYDGAEYRRYFNDIIASSFSMMNAWMAMSHNAYATKNGVMSYRTAVPREAGWMQSYMRMACAIAAHSCENTDARKFLSFFVKWPGHVYDVGVAAGATNPVWNVVDYYHLCGATGGLPHELIGSDMLIGGSMAIVVSWDQASKMFKSKYNGPTAATAQYALRDGDRCIFWRAGRIPANFMGFAPYWVVNWSGTGSSGKFQLSSTDPKTSTTIVDPGNNGADDIDVFCLHAPENAIAFGYAPASYGMNMLGSLAWAKAAGVEVNEALLEAMQQTFVWAMSNARGQYQPSVTPKYVFQTSF